MKGQAEFMEWFPRLILLLAAIVILALLVRYFADRDLDPSEVHIETYLARLHYDDIIMYSDATGRVYPGVIDYEKFNSSPIDEAYGITGAISSKLTLTGCENEEIYHDQNTYINAKPFSIPIGPGGSTVKEQLFPVTIKSALGDCPGTLNITVVRPNS